MKITVYSKSRGVRRLKDGITLEQYRERYPDAVKVRSIPSMKRLEGWISDCGCEAIDGCWVEPDGECEHGFPSWLRGLNMI